MGKLRILQISFIGFVVLRRWNLMSSLRYSSIQLEAVRSLICLHTTDRYLGEMHSCEA